MQKQVSKAHYQFSSYVQKSRWASLWHQLDEVINQRPGRVLEIGPGPGLFKAAARTVGVPVETLDIDPELNPDHVGSVLAMPFADASYDVVCAFQMLEHLPWDDGRQAFREMVRVAGKAVVVSLPDAAVRWRYTVHVPMVGTLQWLIPKPVLRRQVHQFDGEHYWEINKAGFPLSRIKSEFFASPDVVLERTFRVHENPYHRFFVFTKCPVGTRS